MEHNPLMGLFGVSSPRPVEQRVSPQPTEPTENENENVCFEIPSGMVEKLLIISFCSSLGSTLLLIEKATIDPLHLWVIKTLFWRRCRGVTRLW